MKFKVRVTRDYWHEGIIEVEANSNHEAREKALDQIDNTELKIGGIIQDTDQTHEIEEINNK